MQRYRVECNYGSRYFNCAAKAFAFFKQQAARNLEVEIWLVIYCYSERTKRYAAIQELLDYSGSALPKHQ